MTPDNIRLSLRRWLEHLQELLATTSLVEILAATVLPLLAILVGLRLKRYIQGRKNRTLSAKTMDFLAPLIAPTLAAISTGVAALVFTQLGYNGTVADFVTKLCVAWLAVHIVIKLSSGRTAGYFITFVILPVTLLHMFGLWTQTAAFLNSVTFAIGKVEFNLYLIIKAAITLIILLWIVNFALATTDNRLRRVRSMRASNRTLIMKFLQIGLYIIVFLMALNLMGVSLTTLSIFSGALGVGIGFGLQKIASNFISGIILLFERSVQVDDLIELEDGTRGYIRETAARYSRMELFDGREMFIPNEEFISQRVMTLTHMNRQSRVMLPIGVGYGSDVDLVQKLLVDAALSDPRCLRDPGPFAEMYAFGESALNFNLFFWVDDVTAGVGGPRHAILREILRLFTEHGIDIPYPHQVQVGDPALVAKLARMEAKLKAAEKALAATKTADADPVPAKGKKA